VSCLFRECLEEKCAKTGRSTPAVIVLGLSKAEELLSELYTHMLTPMKYNDW